MEYATATKNMKDFHQAVDDFEQAEELLPGSPFVLTVGIRVLANAVVFARHTKDETLAAKWQTRGDEIVRLLKEFPQALAGRTRIAYFYYATGREALAGEIEADLIGPDDRYGVGGIAPWAARLYPRRKAELERGVKEEIADHTALTRFIDARVYLAMVQIDKGETQQALQTFHELQNETVPDAYLLEVLDIPLLLGRFDLAEDLIQRLCNSETLQRQWRWYLYPAQYFAGELDEEEMLQRAEPFCNARCMAHYAVAMKALALGDREKAKRHFEETAKTGMVGAWNYAWAKAFLECMGQDPTWPHSIQK